MTTTNPTPAPAWTETWFSGDETLSFDTPVTDLRWEVSVNRYGSTFTAKLFLMGDGGGPLVTTQVLDVAADTPDADLAAAARAWAAETIANPMTLIFRTLLRPQPESEEPAAEPEEPASGVFEVPSDPTTPIPTPTGWSSEP